MLSQPAPATGAPLSRGDQVRQAARAWNTRRAYHGHWERFRRWAQEQGLGLPDGLDVALGDYLVHLAEQGRRMATIRQARAAIVKGAELTGWPRPDGPDVAEMVGGLARLLRGPQKQAAPLSAEVLAAVRATALAPRWTRGGHTETAECARRRGLLDVALASVMRDGLLRVSEAAALRWGDVELWRTAAGGYGSPSRKPTRRGRGCSSTWARPLSRTCWPSVPRRRRLRGPRRSSGCTRTPSGAAWQQAARAVGLPGWRDITGHSGRVGMSQDLAAAGFALPELMTAGRWKSPRMPARYTERQAAGRGAVARYYQGGRGEGTDIAARMGRRSWN